MPTTKYYPLSSHQDSDLTICTSFTFIMWIQFLFPLFIHASHNLLQNRDMFLYHSEWMDLELFSIFLPVSKNIFLPSMKFFHFYQVSCSADVIPNMSVVYNFLEQNYMLCLSICKVMLTGALKNIFCF